MKNLLRERDMDTLDMFEGMLFMYNKIKKFTTVQEFLQHFEENGIDSNEIDKLLKH
jgi:hypothetical protein